jgi:hypothetical protein
MADLAALNSTHVTYDLFRIGQKALLMRVACHHVKRECEFSLVIGAAQCEVEGNYKIRKP